jgi:hypothetical protein
MGRRTITAALLAALAGLIAMPTPTRAVDDVPGRWSAARANDWYAKQPWRAGCNYIASSAINQLEMFQPDTFDLPTIDREMGYAQSIGFTTVRVFLHNLLWDQGSAAFLGRLDQFVATADKHHVTVMFVLFDSCWDPYPQLGPQHAPVPHRHNSGWVQAPGLEILRDPSKYDGLAPYVKGVVGHFADDRRVVAWDLFNEADNTNDNSYGNGLGAHQELSASDKADRALELMAKAYRWARSASPSQPLTTCVWRGDWSDPAKLPPMDRFSLANSDVISFHNYEGPKKLEAAIASLRQYGRPLICTEYMARPVGSTFAACLPVLREQKAWAYNWGFVDGKSNTIYPWDSWQVNYNGEPPEWFHDIFRPDGTPYRADEVAAIRRETAK